MPDLKEILMKLGNKLVLERGYKPATDSILSPKSTHMIKDFTNWINEHPEAQEVLEELGFNWSMPYRKGLK